MKKRGLPTSGSPTTIQKFTSNVYHATNEDDNPARQTRYSPKKKAWQAAR
jgi:hypothetical protein